ncbi:hemagglutinin repeat-containing protein [Klebsiella aerogenes]
MVSNSAAGSQTQIIAGNDLNLQTLATTHSESGNWGKGNDRSLTQRSDIGTQINGGAVALSAGHDMNARAASVTATSSLTVAAGNDINLSSGESSWHLTENSHQSSSGLLARRSLTTHDEVWAQNAIGSNFSGDSIVMQAGRDLLVSGSSVAGTQDVNLVAGRNLTITTAEERRQENHLRKEKHSGFSGTGGVGFSVGSSSLKATDVTTALSSAASTVGSSQGNLSLSAGNVLTVQGSDLVAGNNMALTGKTVNILAAENQSTQTHTVEQKTSGLTLALSGMVGSAINTAVSSANQASTESNGRLAALSGLQSALSGVQAYQASQMQTADSSPESMIGINLSWGSQSSKSTQRQTQNTSRGSSLMAGNNLSIIATETDINVEGSQLQAGGSALLNAARDVNLFSAENASTLSGKNESHGSSFGVGINFGQGANGLTVSASANAAKGHEKGNSLTHNETTLSAGERVTIVSGRDTTLTGAQVSGHQVTMDVGRNLTLSSEQDSDNYDSKQRSGSVGASGSMGGGSGSLNLSQSKMHSTWASVEAQTGIFAGEGGFDVKVGGHTQLNGSVLASTAAAELNRLDTGTLGFRDIKNYAEYSVEQQSAGVSTSGSVAGQFLGNAASGLLMGANGSGSDSSLTRAAVSEGSIVIRDGANQQQDVTGLSRDAAHANQTLSPIFDKEKEQNRLATAQKIGEIGRQVSDVLVTQGKLNAQAAQSDLAARAAARAKLVAGGNASPSEEQISAQVSRTATADYDTGGKYQKVAQAVTAAMQGLAGGNLAQAASGAVSPYVAEIIHSQTTDSATGKVNVEANAMAHAVWGAIAAASGNNSALAGAAGAVSGELLGRWIAAEYYPDVKTEELSDEQKSTISALSTLAAGLMGGLSGGSSADAVAGAQAGKNAVENNYLHVDEALAFDKEMQSCRATGGDCSSVIAKYQKISDERSAELDTKCAADPVMCQGWDKELAHGGIQAVERPEWMGDIFGLDVMRSDEAKAYVQYWNSVDLAKIDTNSADWAKFAVFISNPENQAALVSAGLLSKDIIKLATATASNIRQGSVLASIKSMQIGLRNPQQVDQIKKDMLSGDYRFTAPEGRIAGYVDSKGTYYISEGNHRMVAAQEIYKKTGDASYIDNLLKNGVWTQTKNAPAGAKSMPKR